MSEVINVEEGGVQFTLCEDGTAIVKRGKESLTGELVIPAVVEHDGKAYHVVEVADMAFMGCAKLTGITLPEGLLEIGCLAFALCAKLKDIILPDGVRKIGGGAFSLCASLTTVSLPKGLTEIEEKMFTGCLKLVSVSIPGSVARMKVDAFNSCMSLERLYFAGDAPELDSTDCESNSLETCRPEIYYLKEAKGWGDTFGGAPTREFFDDPFFSELSKLN